MRSMEYEQPFVNAPVPAVSITIQQLLILSGIAFVLTKCPAPGVITQQCPAAGEALIGIELESMIRGIGEVPHKVCTPELGIRDDPVFRKICQCEQAAPGPEHIQRI